MIVRYLALNPVCADLADTPEEWPWSSYAATMGIAPVPAFLDVDGLLEVFGGGERGRTRLAQFVGEGLRDALGATSAKATAGV
jgi:putative transposase